MRMSTRILTIISLLAGSLWLNNTSKFTDTSASATRLIAHRGVHQIYTGENRTANTCRAESVIPITHHYIENTLPSIRAAFRYGAEVVEIDVHQTTDNVLAVFHDWRLECQTNGHGETHRQNYKTLTSLDIGYGFTDDGISFPLRGRKENRIPALNTILATELTGKLLINFKSNFESDGARLADLAATPTYLNKLYGVYGGKRPTQAALNQTASLKGFDRSFVKSCILRYVATGWFGKIPPACRNTIVAIPMNYAPILWGWPYKFTDRMKAVNTDVILLGPYDGSGFTSGIDDAETLAQVPDRFDGYLWTNRIEIIGPIVKPGNSLYPTAVLKED